MNEQFKIYDEILGKVYQNIISEDRYSSGIYINGYNNDAVSNIYLTLANSYADFTNQKITMVLSPIKYILFILKHWSSRQKYVRYKGTNDKKFVLISTIIAYVCDYVKQPVEIFEDIYKEYYSNK